MGEFQQAMAQNAILLDQDIISYEDATWMELILWCELCYINRGGE